MLQFRDLTAEEIDVRVAMVKKDDEHPEKSGVSLLLYKNARVDMAILDETVHPENWEREHYECKGNLFCKVGINTNFGNPGSLPNWVFKSDCGAESNTEKEKGEASDSFKRACINWGIGRELYTAPFIWVGADGVNIYEKGTQNKKVYATNDKFSVESIKIEKGKIVGLKIKNDKKDKIVFDMNSPITKTPTPKKEVPQNSTAEQMKITAKLKTDIDAVAGELGKITNTAVKKIKIDACNAIKVKGETNTELQQILDYLTNWLNEITTA